MEIKELKSTIAWMMEKKRNMNLTVAESSAVSSFLAEIWMDETSKAVENLRLPMGTVIRHTFTDSYGVFTEHAMVVASHPMEIDIITTGGELKRLSKLEYLMRDYREETLK